MKTVRYSIYSIFLIACLMVSGCEKFLDRTPRSDLSKDGFFGSRKDINLWQTGIYVKLQDAMNSGHFVWGDLRSDLYGQTGPSYVDRRTYTNNLDASMGAYSWQNLYALIAQCNSAIENYPNVTGAGPADYNDPLGQAYGLRALAYFYAIRVWGEVPKIDQSWDGIVGSSRIPRSPVSDIKELIQSDIDQALVRLNSNVTGDRKYYFNRAAAYALKTDVHMWFHEYDEALEASEWFFTDNNLNTFKLISNMDDYRTIFIEPTSSTETIFTLFWDTTESSGCDWCGILGSKGGTGVSVNNWASISRSLFNTFVGRIRSGNGTDARFVANYDTVGIYNLVGTAGNRPPIRETTHWITTTANSFKNKNIKYSPRPTGNVPTAQNTGWYTVLPLTTAEGSPDGRCKILAPLYRIADVYTLRAEALNKKGRRGEALQLVNQIRQRVGYTLDANLEQKPDNLTLEAMGLDFITTEEDWVEWLILEERKLEFIAEGRRWFDLVRSGWVIDVMDPVYTARQIELGADITEATGFGHSGRILAPIVTREFEANPALIGHQNKPYGGSD